MRIEDLDVDWCGERVQIARAGTVIAAGVWRDGALVERTGQLAGDEASLWLAIEAALRDEEEAIVATSAETACDARGVDLTQIDWMLSLTPRERLAVLETHVRSIVPLLRNAPGD